MKPNCTIDTNCIIALEETRDYTDAIKQLIVMHNKGEINLRVVGISASERQPNGSMAPTFSLFRERLEKLGLGNVDILIPPAYWDICYFDHCYFPSAQDTLLELAIHLVLSPNLPFQFTHFEKTADKTIKNWRWKWLNRKCDTLAYMSHVKFGGGLFVSNDKKAFSAQKKEKLLKFGGGDIQLPHAAINRLQDPLPGTPPAVLSFLANCSEEVDYNTIPLEFQALRLNRQTEKTPVVLL